MSTTATDRLAGSWNLNTTHSTATFGVKYMVATFRGSFEQLDVTLADGQLKGAVDVSSIKVKDENLTTHLLAPDFFDAEQFPKIEFASSSIEVEGDTATIAGDLTIKGVTKPLQATGTVAGPDEDFMGNTRLGFTFETTIDRTDFGVSWNADLPKGGKALSDEVTLSVELEFHKA